MNQMTSFNLKSLPIYLTILVIIYLFIDAFAHIIHTWSNQLRRDSIILTISQMISSSILSHNQIQSKPIQRFKRISWSNIQQHGDKINPSINISK